MEKGKEKKKLSLQLPLFISFLCKSHWRRLILIANVIARRDAEKFIWTIFFFTITALQSFWQLRNIFWHGCCFYITEQMKSHTAFLHMAGTEN